jgi:beta-lactamase regulating signal transducer with metallopeptidase domain/uncharacterized membrane protein YkoI
MRNSSQLLLTFLLNACWQIALVAALASFSSWLLRNSAARYRHWIWVAALLLSVGIPLTTSLQILRPDDLTTASLQTVTVVQPEIQPLVTVNTPAAKLRDSSVSTGAFLLNRTTAIVLLSIYFAIVLYNLFRLLQAWATTKRLKNGAILISGESQVEEILNRCSNAIMGTGAPIGIHASTMVSVPITIGILSPMVILPERLLSERNDELLTSAIGHEIIHIRRRDYAFNLVYELLYLPLSFHPCAALIRRRIRQTRELSCDEVVAERIMTAEVYARSLIKLASSAPPLQRLSVSTTVGIADADILEARIMSLLRKPKLDTRLKRAILIAVSLLLLLPCLAAASVAMKFDLTPSDNAALSQESSQQEKERKEKEFGEVRTRIDPRQLEEMKERMENDPKFREEVMAKRELESKMRGIRQSTLIRLAKISMDQAIQIATTQKPGKVLQCSLDAEHWKEPGVLAEDGFVFYHVMLVANEDGETGAVTHVLVNAVDGSVIRAEKELPRKQRQP